MVLKRDAGCDQLKEKLKPAPMDQSARRACLPGTRTDAIKLIMDWYSDGSDDRKSIMWLRGQAGAGKSTLSTTIVRMLDLIHGVNLLGAFFAFNRDFPQYNAATLIRTIAYQLAEFDSNIGSAIEQVIKRVPNIAMQPLADQFELLLSVTALDNAAWSRGPVLVVVDALDESGSADERGDLLRVISEGASKLPRFLRILVVSRPESDISRSFSNSSIRHEELKIDAETGREDIAAFIRSQLQTTKENKIHLRDLLQGWPVEEEVDDLTSLAAGHFIWAATACRLIITSHNPRTKMAKLIKDQAMESSAGAFAKLHELYGIAFQSAGDWSDSSFREQIRDILGVVICARTPLSPIAISSLLKPLAPPLEPRLSVIYTISDCGSVLHWSETDGTVPIRILHTSFRDYLVRRDCNASWAIDVTHHNEQLAHGCIALLEKELRENMCNLKLREPVKNDPFSESVKYACKYWIEHVCLASGSSDDLASAIDGFMRKHLLHWMEALVIMKSYDLATRALTQLLEWAQVCLYHLFDWSSLKWVTRDLSQGAN